MSTRTTINVDQFSIGTPSENTITRRYYIGYKREGWASAERPKDKDKIETVLHVADVTMPALYVGSLQECACWQRDEILAHYGMEA
jgi:hypothetical protein